ncbi:MAG: UPF0158 family protein [Bacteroidales bacterium]|nr:UPF0158 family protein [Bacteroidales bacterium]
MKRYIRQLIQDLEAVAQNPPPIPYIEPPSHLEENPDIAELALVPFKTIEEWTGISQDVFPEMIQLEGGQWEKVNEAIFKVFESLHLELVDAPFGLPPEILYEVLTTNWDYPVQYLPLSGMDLELCTGDPMTCPYGEYCNCGDDFDEEEIPNRFNEVIPIIAENIDAGLVCYLNPDTLEMEDIPQHILNDPKEFEATTGVSLEEEELKHEEWESFFVFEPLDSTESFNIMEQFAKNLKDARLKAKLYHALNHRKPFANFNALIDNSKYREDWFSFKKQMLENHVKQLIFEKINEDSEICLTEIHGFYDDDGTKIEPESVPVPGLCVICSKHRVDDWEENLLCLMNRYDQRNNEDFNCGAYEKI